MAKTDFSPGQPKSPQLTSFIPLRVTLRLSVKLSVPANSQLSSSLIHHTTTMIEHRYDILRDFPHALETKRLKIRLPLPGDGLELFNATVESLDRLKNWLAWAYELQPTLEQSEATACYFRLRFLERKELPLYLFLKGTDSLVGVTGLYNPNWSVPKFEIGYWVREGYENQGYTTEAVEAIGRFAFKHLKAKRLEIQCDPANVASIRVPQKLGFIHETTLHHYKRHHITQELHDVMIFAKIDG